MTHVIIGYGAVGTHLAQALLKRGESVRIVTRNSHESKESSSLAFVAADVTDEESARRAVHGATVVYNAAQAPYDRWTAQLPPLFRGILAAAEQANARLVVADNLYMYGPAAKQPLHESEPYRPVGAKGAVRAMLTEEALTAHQQGRLPVAVARASDFFGPGVVNSALGRTVFPAVVGNGIADVLGDPGTPHSYTYIEDFAECLALLGTGEAGFGRAWHVPTTPAITTRETIALAARIAGTNGRMRSMGRTLLSVAGLFSPMLREFKETLYQFENPFVLDSSDFEKQFGQTPTPLSESLTRTVRWHQRERDAESAGVESFGESIASSPARG